VTDLVLVRHGETTWHADNRYAGGSDVPLTSRGRAEASDLARWARTAGLTGVWASDLSRAQLSARPCAEAVGLELRIDPRLREVDFGQGEGMTPAEMAQTIPHEFAAFQRDPVANHLPGGEDPREAANRGVASLHDIAAADPEGRVLVICHSTLIRLMICSLLGMPLAEYRRVLPLVRNGHLNELRIGIGRAALLSLNVPPVPVPEEGQ
jgi:broad specificity phosphatase PhoE